LPFYSWMEINMPRYVRLMRNFRHEGRSGQARLAAVFVKNVAWKATKLAVKVSGFFVAVNLWNATFFADEEDELSEDQRRQLHLILGRRADGSIRTMRIQGAFSDALSWFGAEDILQDAEAYYKGRKSFGDIAKDSVLATPIKIINAFRPDVKTGAEVLSEQAWYPDPFNPRPIRDKMEHVARMFSADSLYRWLAGKPKRGDSVGERIGNDLMAIGFYYSDPGESAYYETISKVIKHREGKGKEYPGVTPTDKANALYYYKQGLKFGDLGAAEKYLRQYYSLGGSDEGMDMSIKRAHPLGNLAQKDWGAYLKTLSPEEMNTYRRALTWYQDTYLKAPKAQLRAAAKRPAGEEIPQGKKGRLSLKEASKLMQ